MDSAAQSAGEAQVQEVLIDQLFRLGLTRPAGMKVDQFDAMLGEVRAKLAYMTAGGLAALAEVSEGLAGGKSKDRFPLATVILREAVRIETPPDDASPLIRKVMAHGLGQDAIREGWAPELLQALRKDRRWPNPFVVKTIKEGADRAVARLRDLEGRLAREGELPQEAAAWRDRRLAAVQKCRDIAALSEQKGLAR